MTDLASRISGTSRAFRAKHAYKCAVLDIKIVFTIHFSLFPNLKIRGGRMLKTGRWVAVVLCCFFSNVYAQDGYFSNWFQRVDKTQAEQPHWITPMFTITPRLEEEFRYDIGTQQTGSGDVTNFGEGKGFELIPTEHTELIV